MVAPLTVLSIAGSDPSGGAGLQADIRTITLLGGHAMGAPTALTAQNREGVLAVHFLPAAFVSRELEAIFALEKPLAVKTGMLGTAEVAAIVAAQLAHYGAELLVVDPVMVSSSGTRLLALEGMQVLREKLLPLAFVVTPNIPEAEALTGVSISSAADAKEALRVIHRMGARNVVLTGGHWQDGEARDMLYNGRDFEDFSAPFIAVANTHGTGCAFSSALAYFLARGDELPAAVALAKDFVRHRLMAQNN